jgi:hypothetical protein
MSPTRVDPLDRGLTLQPLYYRYPQATYLLWICFLCSPSMSCNWWIFARVVGGQDDTSWVVLLGPLIFSRIQSTLDDAAGGFLISFKPTVLESFNV